MIVEDGKIANARLISNSFEKMQVGDGADDASIRQKGLDHAITNKVSASSITVIGSQIIYEVTFSGSDINGTNISEMGIFSADDAIAAILAAVSCGSSAHPAAHEPMWPTAQSVAFTAVCSSPQNETDCPARGNIFPTDARCFSRDVSSSITPDSAKILAPSAHLHSSEYKWLGKYAGPLDLPSACVDRPRFLQICQRCIKEWCSACNNLQRNHQTRGIRT